MSDFLPGFMKESRICMTIESYYIVFHIFNPKGITLTAFIVTFIFMKVIVVGNLNCYEYETFLVDILTSVKVKSNIFLKMYFLVK